MVSMVSKHGFALALERNGLLPPDSKVRIKRYTTGEFLYSYRFQKTLTVYYTREGKWVYRTDDRVRGESEQSLKQAIINHSRQYQRKKVITYY